MLKGAQTVIRQSDIEDNASKDIIVDVNGVTKFFEQTQEAGKSKNILKNIISPGKKHVVAVKEMSFCIRKGEFVAYAGPNGAGKSTTIKLICGMLSPNSGNVEIFGLSPQKQRIKLMKKTGILFGNRTELWWDHPVISSFEWKQTVWNIPKDEFIKTKTMLIDLLDIGGLLNTFARELSLGQRMRADLAMLLLHNPELILLDEPTLGLDVLAKRDIIKFLKSLNREKHSTIIVTSHDMDDLEEMASRILLISNGQLSFDGSFDKLRKETGSFVRVIITMHGDNHPEIKFGNLISENKGIFEYEINTNEIPIKIVLKELSQIDNISDIEVKKAPIEQIIAHLYESWKK